MDFLLECIGFPPRFDLDELAAYARERGESNPLRGTKGEHLRLPLGGGLELRMDREPGEENWTLLPYYDTPHRLRVAVSSLDRVPDSPGDALLSGWAAPPISAENASKNEQRGAYPLSALLCDARRIPRAIRGGRVLAVSVAGFALDVDYVGENEGVRDPDILSRPRGAHIAPLLMRNDPGGCVDVSLRIREVRTMENPLTGVKVDLLETDAPERPLPVFVSQWQLARDGFEAPRAGWRIEGTFLITGRVAGGLKSASRHVGRAFG